MTTHRTRPVAVLPIALLALAASAVLLAGCASGHEDVPARPVAPVTVRTARVAVATHTRTVDVGGVIRARTTATVCGYSFLSQFASTASLTLPIFSHTVRPDGPLMSCMIVSTCDGSRILLRSF